MKTQQFITLSVLFLCSNLFVHAKENANLSKQEEKSKPAEVKSLMKYASDCEPSSAQADLDINNVRTRILNGGDMWWDLSNARYEIPKVTDLNAVRKNSLFAGAIWIGGEDEGVLKLAAMTYRQGGSDFWPGPLNTVTGSTEKSICEVYDKIYKVTRDEIEKHRSDWENGTLTSINENIKAWPGNGRGGNEPEDLAPFFDEDKNGIYEPENGDYPVLQTECRGIPIERDKNKPSDQPDQMLWFVFNDRGNIHSETQGQSQGLELQTTAFAYATNDEINNMTFYTTKIINRGSNLTDTYFGQWVDPDLGNPTDDYVGCDVELNLGYCYNGDDNDEGILGYGLNPPSIGVDFFEGPKQEVEVNGEITSVELGLSKFVYYNNDFQNQGNPETPIHYYNYLRGKWKNGDCLSRPNGDCADFMFPGTSDPENPTNWTEQTDGNEPDDRRFLQTSGPFDLKRGAVNKLTVGVVWARASSGGATGSLDLLKASSRKAQELFDNCFDILDGPDAPIVEVQELNNEVILLFNDTKRIEAYEEVTVREGQPFTYRFQGYQVYQLKDATVGTGDLGDIDKARMIFTCDLKDTIVRLVNQKYDELLGQPLPKLMIDGQNSGLVHSVSLTEDAFAEGSNKRLVNHKPYYYLVMSYAALPNHPDQEYLAGRKIRQFSVLPHVSAPEMGGLKLQSEYGTGPKITRLEGRGNGGLNIELTTASVRQIVRDGKMDFPEYDLNSGPVNVKIIDPLRVPKGEFEIRLIEIADSTNPIRKLEGLVAHATNWMLINRTTSDTIFSDYEIDYENEQLIQAKKTNDELENWGMSVTVKQVVGPGNTEDDKNGLIDWSVTWEDNSKQWLTAISDIDNGYNYNWIRSGREGATEEQPDYSTHDYRDEFGQPLDKFEVYEKIWDGRIAPYRLASKNIAANTTPQPVRGYNLVQGIAYQGTQPPPHWYNLDNLSSVDLVFTQDESMWSQCLVLEMGEESRLNQDTAHKFEIRNHPSVNKDGSLHPTDSGRTWFPGYAINVETGERLNIILGEDSYQGGNNGKDLKWNPTDKGGNYSSGYGGFGGRHYIYIMDTDSNYRQALYPKGAAYDGGQDYMNRIGHLKGEDYYKELNQQVLFHAMWVIPTYLAQGYKMEYNKNGMPVPPTKATIKLRVNKPYQYYVTSENENRHNPRYSFSTDDLFTDKHIKYGISAMETIRAVPNPYYAYSGYETSPVENRVKFTNLPETCTISIYTLSGDLVKVINKDDLSTEVSWDMKNTAKVPIASGTYIINVDAGELGTKTFKWMGIMRSLDLDSF